MAAAPLAWRTSCGGCQRSSTFDPLAFAGRVHRFPKIAAPMHIQPEIGAVAEHAGKDERGRGGHVAAVVAQFIDVPALHAHRFGQRALRQTHRLHKLFNQDFADAWPCVGLLRLVFWKPWRGLHIKWRRSVICSQPDAEPHRVNLSALAAEALETCSEMSSSALAGDEMKYVGDQIL